MAGLVPAIHAKPHRYLRKARALLSLVSAARVRRTVIRGCDDALKSLATLGASAWMAGTSPAMTGSWVTPSALKGRVARLSTTRTA
jgi:hypothetical protein